MKGDYYPNLVEVFYTNLRVLNGVIYSRVKGVNIAIDDDVMLLVAGLMAEGLLCHVRDSNSNIWLTKRAIYRDCLRYPGRIEKKVDVLNKEPPINDSTTDDSDYEDMSTNEDSMGTSES
ncbi:hypothetical protein LR48_Vigan347s002700 [Vigna angularis]|uniref:Uncharacterized protein n=1 Tax=Phaseolus angularis TaxID=3914 RepID=A0A0L9T8S6_PHAAN|nr:hypothetical protein LR48_Vigan347s002700 [Vigna angularis]